MTRRPGRSSRRDYTGLYAALTAGDVPAEGLKGRTHVGRPRSASPAVNVDKIERLLRKAERDARLLDGRDFKMRPFAEAYRLLDMIREREEQ